MIPKQIHLCWLSGDPYPAKIEKCLASWKKFLPDYEVVLWDTKRFDLDAVPWVKQAFEAKKYAFAADSIRFYALYNYGGIYLDSDVEVLRSFDPLLDLPYFAGAETAGTIEAAVLGDKESATFQEQDSSGTVAKMVSETPGAISYLAFSYFDDQTKALSVDGVAPETANVEDNSWTIWAYEHMYTALEPDAATQAFIDYMMSDEVQGSLVEENGYIPVSGMKVEKDAEGNVTEL